MKSVVASIALVVLPIGFSYLKADIPDPIRKLLGAFVLAGFIGLLWAAFTPAPHAASTGHGAGIGHGGPPKTEKPHD